ncbi:MAG: PilW family protein [Rubrivivax sp.]
MCAELRSATRPRRGQRGLSIIEVMVGMVVALLVGLAASGGAAVFTASQRQGVGAGGMTVNSATALSAIKNDAATAGLGFFGDSAFLCYTLDLSVGAAVKLDAASFAPVRIGSSGVSDQLDVVSASNVDSGANVLLSGNSSGASAAVKSRLPAAVGQAVLLAPATAGNTCMVRSVTAVTAATDTTPQSLSFGSTGDHNGAAFAAAASFVDKDRVALLGTLQWSRYRVSGTNLLLERPLGNQSATLVRNVMAFRAQYGISASAADTTLTGWQDATGATWGTLAGANVERVRALRIGLLTRSPQREKEDKNGNCTATTSLPRDPLDASKTVTPDVTDWQCYRYRSSVAVVPLRNLAW